VRLTPIITWNDVRSSALDNGQRSPKKLLAGLVESRLKR
jgi:hypothetical protein